MIKLGILDQSHINEGQTAATTLADTTRLAQEADKLGYGRYWISEHHAGKMLSFSSPEILIAHLAAATSRIRVGSGGIMLPHYSAYKVAENFKLLEALHPGRIDVGLGRAPGGMPMATRALQENKFVDINKYPQQIMDLIGYLREKMSEGHPFAGLHAAPSIEQIPEVWLLGSSYESARIAAQLGTSYAFAQFFGTQGGETAMKHYLENFEPSVINDKAHSMIAVLAICADTQEEANELALSTDLFFLLLENGVDQLSFPSVQTAYDYPYTESDLYRINRARERRIIGTPEQVKAGILKMAEQYQADEVLVMSSIHNFDARVKSYRLIAEAFGLQGQGQE
ncbi:LLM class flavin-dependent oxidoreductase [Paenibacillus glycanilyticus]|uniref:LLM class flavin-dependent oxidoreductase n=1 Tax=Paenibacillus glycanilyticus TaxID=126569 RepID=UPI00203ED0EA|nr:LLM class flavin-dependent oxidoreductase [Paenibacillus glycanilyticus]MCM3630708.1 LLM class flavin-dependent oxidoreductase [Paenibacillus glycanilyticus]